MWDYAGNKQTISLHASLCEAFGPWFLNNSPTVLKNIIRGAGETVKSRMQGYDSKPSMLTFWSWKPIICAGFGKVCGRMRLHATMQDIMQDIMRDIMRDVLTQSSHYSMRPRDGLLLLLCGMQVKPYPLAILANDNIWFSPSIEIQSAAPRSELCNRLCLCGMSKRMCMLWYVQTHESA